MVAPSYKSVRDYADKVKTYTQSCGFVQRRGIIERYIDEIVATQAIIRVRGYVPLEKEQEYVNFKTVCRDCGVAECG